MKPRFNSILLSITEGCRVGCAHCGFRGSTRERKTASEDIVDWVGQACRYGVPLLIFTGGEPFERFDVLSVAVAEANAKGVPSAVFTSSYWAASLPEAKRQLGELKGLNHIYLSSDIYHQRRVPYGYVYNAIDAAISLGISKITICITYAKETERIEVRANYEKYGDHLRFYEERVIPTKYLPSSVLFHQDGLRPPNPTEFKCKCFLETPLINPNGDVFACHAGKAGAHGDLSSLPYWLGNLKDNSLEEIMDRSSRRADYQFLRTYGPNGISSLIENHPELLEAIGRDGFTNPCDMCFSALSSEVGQRILNKHVSNSSVRDEINIRLVLGLHEEQSELQDGPDHL